MNDGRNELNNLLLDKQYAKSGTSMKKIIIIGLLLFGVAIGIFLLMKTLNEDDTLSNNLIEPSILEQQSIKQSNPSLFKNINNTDIPKDEPNKKIKNITSDLLKQLTDKNQKEKEQEMALSKKMPVENQIENKQYKQQPQDIRNLGQAKRQTKPRYSPPPLPTEAKKGFYVQVGAFYTRDPDKPFLNSITRKNYSYYLYKIKINNKNLTKVLIGPYETKGDAQAKIADIKTIEKDAYILKIN